MIIHSSLFIKSRNENNNKIVQKYKIQIKIRLFRF